MSEPGQPAPDHCHHLDICLGPACNARGSQWLLEALEEQHQLAPGQTSVDGRLTVGEIFCAGACGTSPNVILDGTLHRRVSGHKLKALLEPLKGS